MTWTVKITKTATKQLKKLDTVAQKRILAFLKTKLEKTDNPRKNGKALRGGQGELWRYRIGDYRVICSFNNESVTILTLAVGHRKEVYRKDI